MELFIFLTVVGTSITVVLGAKLLFLNRTNKLYEVMIMELQIEGLLQEIIEKTCVDRALLCSVHNGGPNIVVGSPKRITVIVEPKNSLEPFTKSVYQEFPIDSDYKLLLIEMMESRFLLKKVDDMNPGILHRKTTSDNLKEVLHIPLYGTKEAFYYLFLATRNDQNRLLGDWKEYTTLEEKVQKVRRLISRAISKKLLR